VNRCHSRHPYTDRQCINEAGHEGQHTPEPYSPNEAEKWSTVAANTLRQVVARWTDQRMPIGCIASSLVGAFIQVARGTDFSDAVILEMVVQMMGKVEPDGEQLSKLEILKRVAAMLECPVEEIA